ncbi:MAG: nuclear transport factor 2 family protein [Oscillospiraceae bacterium]|nr:nuclear transport factor 2 family protein [Oscillospiraceae bacterium]
MNEISLHQRVLNAVGSQAVENVKGLHSYYHGRADATSEWANLWSRSDDCSWAHAFGRMRGFDQVWYGSVTEYDKMAMENWLAMYKRYPEIGGKDPRPLLECSVHTLVTDIIEVASDGKTARGSFITPGLIHSRLNPHGSKYCGIMWERYGSDFICEDGQWKYLHEHVCPDIMGKLDIGNWAADEFDALAHPEREREMPPLLEGPPVTDPGPMHMPYSVISAPPNTVPWPEPYETMDDNNTYTKKNYTHVINFSSLGKVLGVKEEEFTPPIPDGKPMKRQIWTLDAVQQAIESVKKHKIPGTKVALDGHLEFWIIMAVAKSLEPECECFYVAPGEEGMPKPGAPMKFVNIPFYPVSWGKAGPQGFSASVSEEGDIVYIDFKVDDDVSWMDQLNVIAPHLTLPIVPEGKTLCFKAEAHFPIMWVVLKAYEKCAKSIFCAGRADNAYRCYLPGGGHSLGDSLPFRK